MPDQQKSDEILWADSILFGPGLEYGKDEEKLKEDIYLTIQNVNNMIDNLSKNPPPTW